MTKEIYSTNVKQISLNVVNSEIESVRKKNILKTGLRIYKDNYIGVAGTIGKYEEKLLEKKALHALKNKILYPYNVSSSLSKKVELKEMNMSESDFLKNAEELLTSLKSNHKDFIFSNKLQIAGINVSLKNDKGLDLNFSDRAITIGLNFKEKNSSNIFDGGVTCAGRKYDKQGFINYVDSICNAYKNPVELPEYNKKYPILFDDTETLPFLKFYSDLDGFSIGTKSSIFTEKIGQKVFNKNFTLYQTLNYNDDILSPFFDAEGVINENYRYPLIENGVIKSPYTDKKTAAIFKLPQTGSASASYDGVPSLGGKKMVIKNSEKTLKELLNGEKGILILMAAGGDYTPDGHFSTPVNLALLFDGEKIIGRLPQLQISSDIYSMYGNDFIGRSSDTVNCVDNDKLTVFNMLTSKI